MEHVEKLRRRSALRRDAPIYRPDEFPSAALRRPAGAAPALGVSGGQYDDYGRRVADRDNGRTAYDGHGQSRKPLHPAGQIPFRSACQPLGDASGVRHGRRPDAHHIRGRRGMAHQNAYARPALPRTGLLLLHAAQLFPGGRRIETPYQCGSLQARPHQLRPEGGAELQMGGARQCGVDTDCR